MSISELDLNVNENDNDLYKCVLSVQPRPTNDYNHEEYLRLNWAVGANVLARRARSPEAVQLHNDVTYAAQARTQYCTTETEAAAETDAETEATWPAEVKQARSVCFGADRQTRTSVLLFAVAVSLAVVMLVTQAVVLRNFYSWHDSSIETIKVSLLSEKSQLKLNITELQAQIVGLQSKIQDDEILFNSTTSQLKLNITELQVQIVGLQTKYEEGQKGKTLEVFCNSTGSLVLGKTCYKYYPNRKTFQDAKTTCDKEGGMLAIVDREDIHEALKQTGIFKYWIGMEDVSIVPGNNNLSCTNKIRKWLNGRYLTYANWKTNNPSCTNGELHESCVENSEDNWDDVFCSFNSSFFCQFTDFWS